MDDLASSAFPSFSVDSGLGSVAKLPTRRLQTPEPGSIGLRYTGGRIPCRWPG